MAIVDGDAASCAVLVEETAPFRHVDGEFRERRLPTPSHYRVMMQCIGCLAEDDASFMPRHLKVISFERRC